MKEKMSKENLTELQEMLNLLADANLSVNC